MKNLFNRRKYVSIVIVIVYLSIMLGMIVDNRVMKELFVQNDVYIMRKKKRKLGFLFVKFIVYQMMMLYVIVKMVRNGI